MSQVTLTWAVNNMTRVVDDGFVVVVDWSCTASATGGEPGGLFLTLEYMTNNPSYSIQSNSIVLA